MSLLNGHACYFTFPATVFLKMLYADKWQCCRFLILPINEFCPYFSNFSSLGKEKTVAHSYPGKSERQSTTQYLYTITYFYYYFPRFVFLSSLFKSHQTNSYMKTHKHENIKIFEKHAPGVLLIAF